MKLLSIPRRRRHYFPYVITQAFGGFLRSRMDLYAECGDGSPVDGFDRATIGYRGPGHISPTVRMNLIDHFSRCARRSHSSYCIVFDENDCVHILSDGTSWEGVTPPQADTLDSRDYDEVPYPLLDLWYAALPSGSAASHICIRKLCADRFEIASGSACVLGILNETDHDGLDPAAAFLDARGRFVPPSTFMGVRVTGVRDGRTLLGPIQSDGDTSHVVKPWLDEVLKASLAVAKRQLPRALMETIWRIVDPKRTDITWVGVLEAA